MDGRPSYGISRVVRDGEETTYLVAFMVILRVIFVDLCLFLEVKAPGHEPTRQIRVKSTTSKHTL